jgi:hypothetical protein
MQWRHVNQPTPLCCCHQRYWMTCHGGYARLLTRKHAVYSLPAVWRLSRMGLSRWTRVPHGTHRPRACTLMRPCLALVAASQQAVNTFHGSGQCWKLSLATLATARWQVLYLRPRSGAITLWTCCFPFPTRGVLFNRCDLCPRMIASSLSLCEWRLLCRSL